jgi:hypothetical protein
MAEPRLKKRAMLVPATIFAALLQLSSSASQVQNAGGQTGDTAGAAPPTETNTPGPWATLPPTGQVPPIFDPKSVPSDADLAARAVAREYEKQLRQIRFRYFVRKKAAELRAEGLKQLREFTDPAAFAPMIEVFAKEEDDIRLAMLDHFAAQGDPGQAALAHVAIYLGDAALANEAELRMTQPVGQWVLAVFDRALRSGNHTTANRAASLAGSLNVIQAIPLLIFAQASTTTTGEGETGDLAWIAIETQRAYVQGLVPVTGAGSAAFAPIIGTISEGSVLRIQDAVVVTYRTIVHQVLVTMTSADWGDSTDELGYGIEGWWAWYNDQYVPFKNEQAALSETPGEGTAETGEGSANNSP